jgi:hypothetical protein
VLVIRLDADVMRRLAAGQPALIDTGQLGLPAMTVLVVGTHHQVSTRGVGSAGGSLPVLTPTPVEEVRAAPAKTDAGAALHR